MPDRDPTAIMASSLCVALPILASWGRVWSQFK
jgi:hypothetical protein